jgi:hypothetical protein
MMTATDEGTHRCPAKRCPRQVPDHLLMCGEHWRMVPGPVQRSVNRAWQGGAGRYSTELMAAQAAAVRVVNERLERTPPDA